ncbi:MAG: DEAD/DEAH box helicase [Candidatus Lokiarchaeota archaeon]|nr:DEAD/DEAH box helicase [Candidatus Lokiarchaeota archaeon]
MNFSELGISAKNVNALEENMNITTPTPVQEKAIPLILKGKNIMAQSKTGTGKTLAFILPIVQKLEGSDKKCLILAPTRELAKQIFRVVGTLGNGDINAMTIYGGVSITNQIEKLKTGIQLIIGTPGRIIDLYKRRKLNLSHVDYVVLDEGDRLWDMGFAPDIKYILRQIKSSYQLMLFSATLDYDMRELVKKHTRNSFEFLNLSRDELTVKNTLQFYYMIQIYQKKYKTFIEVLQMEKPEHALVFVNTRKTAEWLSNKLRREKRLKYKVGMLSGKLSQAQREKMLKKFRKRKINILVATDVAARGLDISDISHVINYDIPKYPEVYVHRIGRTSRMKKKGIAISLVLEDEYIHLCNIEALIEKEIQERKTYRQKERHNTFTIY